MQAAARLGLALLAVLVAGIVASADGVTARFRSGHYEQLILAVDPRGRVTGYYREDQGQGVVKRCAFYIAGRGKGGAIAVVTWSERAFPGTLTAQKDGVNLRIAQGREHAGCGLVLLPQISQGLDLDRVGDGKWTELRKISSPRAYIHSAPDTAENRKAFGVSGDLVGVISKQGAWLNVDYFGRNGTVRGWIRANTSSKLVPPES